MGKNWMKNKNCKVTGNDDFFDVACWSKVQCDNVPCFSEKSAYEMMFIAKILCQSNNINQAKVANTWQTSRDGND